MLGTLKKYKKGYSLMVNDVEIAIHDIERTERTLYSLSKENCDEIFGITNINKLAENLVDRETNSSIESPIRKQYEKYVNIGLKEAMKLKKDKLFTIDDMMQSIITTQVSGVIHTQEDRLELIQSFLQERNVEIEIFTSDELKSIEDDWVKLNKPKLDADGNLILKRK